MQTYIEHNPPLPNSTIAQYSKTLERVLENRQFKTVSLSVGPIIT